MARPDVCRVIGWTLREEERRLVFTPSARSFAGVLGGSAVLLVFAGLVVWWLGMPPGSASLNRQRAAAVQLIMDADEADTQARRAEVSAVGNPSGGPSAAASLRRRADDLRQRADLAEQRLSGRTPTLGTVGDTVYWCVVLGLAGLAVAMPVVHAFERVVIDVSEPGDLRVRRRCQVLRSRQYRVDGFAVIAVTAERIVRHSRKTGTEDRGWRWSVALVPRDEAARALVIQPEQEPTLPVRVERMTPRVRAVVEFLQRATGLPVAPPVTADVSRVTDYGIATEVKRRVRRHGPVEDRPYKPL